MLYEVITNKGIVLMKQKRYDEAIDIFKKHGQITGQAQHALMLIAECFEETGDFDKAAFYYSEAVNENPKYDRITSYNVCYTKLLRKPYLCTII